jgi:hypothetical protein
MASRSRRASLLCTQDRGPEDRACRQTSRCRATPTCSLCRSWGRSLSVENAEQQTGRTWK